MSLTINEISPLIQKLDSKRSDSIPKPASLSKYLRTFKPAFSGLVEINDATLFISAAMEMWQRSINSLILSVAWSDVSRTWGVVTAYYSSHYMIRAFAHLHGYYSLHKEASIELSKNVKGFQITCGKRRNEHEYYWKAVSDLKLNEKLFGKNTEQVHRGFASYQDHLHDFKKLDKKSIPNLAEVQMKVATIADLPYNPLDDSKIPDLTTIQCLSYQRICFYRNWFESKFGSSKYWKSLRTPQWCASVMSYKTSTPQSSLANMER